MTLPPPLSDEEYSAIILARVAEIDQARSLVTATRTALTDALALIDLYPAPTPEETAIIDAQVTAALAGFRTMTDPPADVVALAASLVSWRADR